MSSHTKALIALIVAALLWATAGVVAKELIHGLHPFVITTYRFAIASLIIFPFFWKEKKPKHYWKVLIPLSLLNSANVILYYVALTTTTANSAVVINAASPLLTAFFARILIKEKTSAIQIVGIIIGLSGVLLVTLLPLLSVGKGLGGNIIGNSLVISATLCWVLYSIGSRHVLATATYSPLTTASMNFFVTTVVAFLIALTTHQSWYTPVLWQPSYVATLLFAGIAITVVTFYLFQWAVQHLSATTASLKDYIQLVGGVGLNTILLGEKLSGTFLLGGALVILGIFIAMGKRVSKRIALLLFSQGE